MKNIFTCFVVLLLALAGCALETGPVDYRMIESPGMLGAPCSTGCSR